MRVLLADDHRMMREGLRAVLERAGVDVVGEAADGRQVIVETRRIRPDGVVMDIAMPKVNGVDATRELKKTMPDVTVIALSMNADQCYVIAMLEAGAKGYLLKSAASEELLTALRVVKSGETYVSPAIVGVVVGHAVQATSCRTSRSLELSGFSSTELGGRPRRRQVLQGDSYYPRHREGVAAADLRDVQATITNARVTLKGAVASQEDKTAFEDDVEEVPGVVALDDQLKVRGYGPETLIAAPESIRHRAIENIFWDPRVASDKVSVDVDPDGDVTLSGRVDSWEEARAVNDDAVRAGAAHVMNRVQVAEVAGDVAHQDQVRNGQVFGPLTIFSSPTPGGRLRPVLAAHFSVADAPLAGVLDLVHDRVGDRHDLIERSHGFVQRHDPDTERDRPPMRAHRLAQPSDDPADGILRGLRGGVGQKHREFVAAESRRDIGCAA